MCGIGGQGRGGLVGENGEMCSQAQEIEEQEALIDWLSCGVRGGPVVRVVWLLVCGTPWTGWMQFIQQYGVMGTGWEARMEAACPDRTWAATATAP